MDLAKSMVFKTFILYLPLFSIFPHFDSITVPFGSVSRHTLECIWIRFGFTKYRVLPEPDTRR